MDYPCIRACLLHVIQRHNWEAHACTYERTNELELDLHAEGQSVWRSQLLAVFPFFFVVAVSSFFNVIHDFLYSWTGISAGAGMLCKREKSDIYISSGSTELPVGSILAFERERELRKKGRLQGKRRKKWRERENEGTNELCTCVCVQRKEKERKLLFSSV